MLWNLVVHHRANNSPPLVPIQSHTNPLDIPSNLLRFYNNITLPSSTWSSNWSLCFRFPQIKILYPFLLALLRFTCPAHLIILALIIRIFGEKYNSWSSSYVVFSTPLLPSKAQILSLPYSRPPSAYVEPPSKRTSFATLHNKREARTAQSV